MCSKNLNNSGINIDPVHVAGIDLKDYIPIEGRYDVVLIPLISADNIYLHNWPYYYCDGQLYVPYFGVMWPVHFVAATLLVCDEYVC